VGRFTAGREEKWERQGKGTEARKRGLAYGINALDGVW